MASIRKRERKDGGISWAVLYIYDGKQTSASFADKAKAEQFRDLVNTVGPQRARLALGMAEHVSKAAPKGQTVGQYLDHYIEHLTGIEPRTRHEYRRYAERDLKPLSAMPLASLGRDDVAAWVNGLEGSPKTVANKHGFLAGALKTAVMAGKISASPCEGIRLPRSRQGPEKAEREMTFLERDEYRAIRDELPEREQPLADFLVTSGMRFSEATALTPAHINRKDNTVHVRQAWKKQPSGGYKMGPPKTPKSRRTINVPKHVLDALDYSGEYVFTNTRGKPLFVYTWRENTWYPAVERAKVDGKPLGKRPVVHDLRHTCVSWLIAAGIPLPAIQVHLGHESIKTTIDRYGHLDRTAGAGVADAMAAALGGK
ncbi:tyrosine-type recombinase/integrase [Mycolicibacterium sp. CBM1]